MKLSKAKLIKMVKPKLEDLGFTEFKDTKSGSQGLFIKRINQDLYLTFGLTIHRYYDSAFTGDFYLSKNTIIGAQWGDIPKEIYERPSFLLTNEERSLYPEDNINVKGSYDIWWDGSDEKSVLDFLRVIELTEPRFINQPELLEKIEQSEEIKILVNHAEAVKKLVVTNQTDGLYSFQPSKEVDGIPFVWFKASEKVLKESKEILNAYTVIRLAADAYRQYILENIKDN